MFDILHPAAPLGRGRPWLTGDDAFATRIRMVLETRPGQLPWRPDFGCDLDSLVGQPATPQRVNEARRRVERALRRWLPEVTVNACTVRMVGSADDLGYGGYRDVPLAEAALLTFGPETSLEVLLDLETPEGSLAVQAVLDP